MHHHWVDFLRLWFKKRPAALQTSHPSPVHTQLDDYLDTNPNSRVEVLEEDQQWMDLTVVDQDGNGKMISLAEPLPLETKVEKKRKKRGGRR